MRNLGDNKKGQGLELSTIILIVLGIAVLIFLIFGFYTGWSSLWGRITNLGGGGGSNIDSVRQGCMVACVGQSNSDWCTTKRTVKYDEAVEISGVKKKSVVGTCNEFADPTKAVNYPGVNVEACTITCN